MAIHGMTAGMAGRGSPQTAKVTALQAPTGGMDARQNLATATANECLYTYNLEAAENGMRLRRGYREWAVGVTSGISDGVRTVIPYTGEPSTGTDDRLFAVTKEGIYDATVRDAVPVLKLTFPNQSNDAGWGVYTHYTTDAGVNIVFYADQANGLHTYDPNTDTWVPTTDITGLSPTAIVSVVAHKQRIWFAARDQATGYYLGVGAISGEAKPFYFGSKFKHGGELVGLYNWSVDGGVGLDDHLVAVSRGGDVLPYRGTDPSSSTDWDNIGTFFIGRVPRGSKIGEQYGGDLQLLSVFGVTSMSDLLEGVSAKDIAGNSIAYKISTLIRDDMRSLSNVNGWEMRYLPSEGIFIINVPKTEGRTPIQYVLSIVTNGWSIWRDINMLCSDMWQGAIMFGDAQNRVLRMDVSRDNVILNETDSGTDIEFSIMMNPQHLGSPAQFKRGELVRPTFLGFINPTYETTLLYDYNHQEPVAPTGFTVTDKAIWDSATWDNAFWDSGQSESYSKILGGLGIGRTISIAIRGRASAQITLIQTDLVWREGGVL
jgi:hypothetical protein